MSSTAAQIFVAGPRELRTRRPARTSVGLILMSLMLTLAIQRVVIAAPRGASAHGALRVQSVNGNGKVSPSSRVIDVSGAFPGMQAQISTFGVRNTGTAPVAFVISATGLIANASHSLDDVLRLVVRDRSSGAVAYRGRISGLQIAHTGLLAAGSMAAYTVEVTWHSSPVDAAYAGAGLGFTVVASPSVG